MVDEYIRKQEAIDIVAFECGKWTGLAKEISKQLKQLPAADVAPVVRCDDCVYYGSRRKRRETMTDEYIRKADVKDALQEKVFHNLTDEFYGAMQVLDELPSADVVQVVRCRECKRCSYDPLFNYYWCDLTLSTRRVKPDDFCSYGERKEE